MSDVDRIARQIPGVDKVITIAGISALDSNATLSNAGVAYIILKDWAARGRSEDLAALYPAVSRALSAVEDGRVLVLPPPPIQGIGNAGGFSMQIELRDGSFDLAKLQGSVNAVIAAAETQSGLQRVSTSFRADVPQYQVTVDRAKAEALGLTTDAVFQSLASYMGSSYVNQFNKFGRVFQVYVQGDSQFRLTPDAIQSLTVTQRQWQHDPDRHGADGYARVSGRRCISLYNLYPDRLDRRRAGASFTSGRGDGADGADRQPHAAARHRLRAGRRSPTRRSWSATSSTGCSVWRCCWSIWCSPANMRAG